MSHLEQVHVLTADPISFPPRKAVERKFEIFLTDDDEVAIEYPTGETVWGKDAENQPHPTLFLCRNRRHAQTDSILFVCESHAFTVSFSRYGKSKTKRPNNRNDSPFNRVTFPSHPGREGNVVYTGFVRSDIPDDLPKEERTWKFSITIKVGGSTKQLDPHVVVFP
jgi:hypothetical protein